MARTFGSFINIFREKHTDATLDGKISVVSEQIKEAFDKQGINYNITDARKSGKFAEQMLDFATAEKADMIMIMTDADIFSPNFNAGAWDEKMMFNKAEIPVMCINPVMTGKVYYEYITLL
jgi:hypothetical protein